MLSVKKISLNWKSRACSDALEWVAAMTSHIPNKGEQMVRYYGSTLTSAAGAAKKPKTMTRFLAEPALSSKQFRKNWARLIHKTYEVDPLLCPNCNGTMQVIAFIEDSGVIKKILKHLRLWRVKRNPPPFISVPAMWCSALLGFCCLSASFGASELPLLCPKRFCCYTVMRSFPFLRFFRE